MTRKDIPPPPSAVWTTPPSPWLLGQMDNSSDDEVVTANYSGGQGQEYVQIFDLVTGTLKFTSPMFYVIIPTIIRDIDHDGKDELLLAGRTSAADTGSIYVIKDAGSESVQSQGELLERPQLEQNFPNPFNPTTTIEYSVPERENVQIRIYDSVGRLVRTIVDQESKRGAFRLVWDGTGDSGERVASGTYFYQARIGDFLQARKMLLVR